MSSAACGLQVAKSQDAVFAVKLQLVTFPSCQYWHAAYYGRAWAGIGVGLTLLHPHRHTSPSKGSLRACLQFLIAMNSIRRAPAQCQRTPAWQVRSCTHDCRSPATLFAAARLAGPPCTHASNTPCLSSSWAFACTGPPHQRAQGRTKTHCRAPARPFEPSLEHASYQDCTGPRCRRPVWGRRRAPTPSCARGRC